LIIKSSDDVTFVKNIEVKSVYSPNPNKIAKNIEEARKQIKKGDTVAIFLRNFVKGEAGMKFAEEGISIARRKNLIIGPIEIWFSDKKFVLLEE